MGQIQRAIASGRLASTWIFAGPAGVGKFTTAVEFAKTVLCDQPKKVANGTLAYPIVHLAKNFELTVPCGVCDSCKAIGPAGAGAHPDLHIVTKELIRMHDRAGKSMGTTISIQVIRGEITGDPASGTESKMAKRSFRGRGKFFIVDEAELMEGPAQNALLKTLEEPPAGSYLILVTANQAGLLSTIRSRSQIVEFHPLPDALITQALAPAGLTETDAALIARLARGSLGRALEWSKDIRFIEEQLQKDAEKAEKKKAAKGEDDEDEEAWSRGGILGWTRALGEKLDALVAGKATASEVGDVIADAAAQYAKLQVRRDRLMSADRAKRDGIGLMMTVAAEWFGDRMRHGLGTPHETVLPGETGALDYGIAPELIKTARDAEYWADRNVNDKMLLAAATTRWEELLHGAAASPA